METKYILAIAVFVVWIALRLFLMHRRNVRVKRWLEERDAEEAQQAEESNLPADAKDNSDSAKP